MQQGVVWFGEQLLWNELQRVENFLDGGACDVVIAAKTVATELHHRLGAARRVEGWRPTF